MNEHRNKRTEKQISLRYIQDKSYLKILELSQQRP
jgi:hypothetical protein